MLYRKRPADYPLESFTPGTRALYNNTIQAEIIRTASNGVTIGFWGFGLQEGKWIVKRVSRKFLQRIEV